MVHAPSAEMVTPDSMGGLWHPVQEHSVHWGAPHSQCGYRQEKAGAGLGALDAIPSFPPQPAQGVLHLGSKRRALNPKALTVGICQNRCPTCWRQPVPLKVGCVVTTRRVATRGRVAGRARRGPPAAVPFRSVPGASRPAGEAAEPLCLPPAPSGAGQHRQGRAAAGRAPMGGGGPGRAARPCPRPYNCRERGVPYTASRAEPGRRCWCADLLPAGAPDRCVPARAEPGSPGRPRGGVQGRRGARRAELCPPAVGGRTAARLPRRVQRGVFLAGRRWGVLRDPRSELAWTGVGSGAVPGSLALSRVSPCRGLEPWLST